MAIQKEKNIPGSKEIKGQSPLTVFFEDERARERRLVGGKGRGLALLKSIPEIAKKVPNGFTITAPVYDQIIQHNPQIATKVKELDEYSISWVKAKLSDDKEAIKNWEQKIVSGGNYLKEELEKVMLLPELENIIGKSYDKLCEVVGKKNVNVAVRSSSEQEDGLEKSNAGQNSTFLNRQGKDAVIESFKECIASQFGARAIVYRNNERLRISEETLKNSQKKIELSEVLARSKAFSHSKSRMAVVIQEMIKSEKSGVVMTVDTVTGAPRIDIELNHGIGESVVSGEATPDFFEVDRNNPKNIVGRRLGAKGVKTTCSEGGTENIKASQEEINKFAAADPKIIEIAKDASIIRQALGIEIDGEFAVDEKEDIKWVQVRAITAGLDKDPNVVEMRRNVIPEEIAKNAEVVLEGGMIGSPGVAAGTKLIANTVEEATRIMELEENIGKSWILVTDMTSPDWVPVMKKVVGIITKHGGRTCHAAIVSRELGVPALVGTEKEIEALRNDSIKEITLDVGNRKVYKGILFLKEVGENIDVKEIKKNPTDTIVGINMSMTDEAKKLHALAELGDKFKITLLRIEFLLQEIGIHVNALIDFDKGIFKRDPAKQALHKKIADKLTKEGYSSGKEYFVTKLSEGIASIAANFPDSDITLRTTDFKTNEYESLIGGKEYESEERNPMIGWRGLVRSLSPENREAFKLELEAIKKARNIGYKKIRIMFPMVRDPLELSGSSEEMEKWYGKGFKSAYDIMKEVGLERKRDELKVGIMIEDETNVERLDEYIAAGIDFGSIGSNDLTQLVMATDRDNEILQKILRYSETNTAVIRKIRRVIRSCKEKGLDIGICGDAPSSSREIVKILTEEGISSMGVTPDVYLKTYRLVKVEEEMMKLGGKGIDGGTTIFQAHPTDDEGNGKKRSTQ